MSNGVTAKVEKVEKRSATGLRRSVSNGVIDPTLAPPSHEPHISPPDSLESTGGHVTPREEEAGQPTPGLSGLDGSCCGIEAKSNGGSCAPFHGRFIRCGATITL